MKHYKKIILTLVALLAVTAGAWADETPLVTIESKDYTSFKSGSKTFDDMVTVTFSNSVDNNGNEWGWYSTGASLLTVAGTNGYTITSCKFYTYNGPAKTGYTVEGESPSVYIYNGNVYTDDSKSVSIGTFGVTKIEVYTGAASSGTTVTFTRGTGDDSNKWTMDNGMPAGNVEVAPEYYPQATVATGGVTAATGVQATTDAELVTIDATKLTGATTLKYIVTTDATPAPAYDATGWTSDIPTAANITTVGLTYVWYYPVGTDDEDPAKTYSDGDICKEPISVSIQPAPTYAITLAEDTEEADKWTISSAEAIKGSTITATYTGTKKVIGMTVTKRVSLAYPITISEVTDEAYIGSVVAADGYVYATLDDVDNASKTPVAKICYVGSETGDATYKHGLALALRDVSGTPEWCTNGRKNCLGSQYTTVAEAKGDLAGIANTDVLVGTTPHSHGDNAAKAARGYNSGTHPEGTSAWFLPSVGQWDKMATAVGDYLKLGLNSGNYWSSTEIDAENAWTVHVDDGSWSTGRKYYYQGIRACLAF